MTNYPNRIVESLTLTFGGTTCSAAEHVEATLHQLRALQFGITMLVLLSRASADV